MKIARKKAPDLPGIIAPARVDSNTAQLLRRARRGDIVVMDHVDLDRATAQQLIDADVAAVINVGPMISGRYANRGPQLLAEAGITVVEHAGPQILTVKDGSTVRLDGGVLHAGTVEVSAGTELNLELIGDQMAEARAGMLNQLATFTHNSTEFLQHEEPLLLHDSGLPELRADMQDRPVVVVGPGAAGATELKLIKRFVAEQKPILIGIDQGAQTIRDAGHKPQVIVLGDAAAPKAAVLATARDLVVRVNPGTQRAIVEGHERAGLQPKALDSTATPEDLALLLALFGGASVIIAAGLDATLEEFLDSDRGGLASTFLTRLKVGPRLVDAQVVPVLYSGRVRAIHLFWLVLAGLIALAAAFAVASPLGEQWAHDVWDWMRDAVDSIQGKLS